MTDDRVEKLAKSLRQALGEPRLTVRAWRAGADFWADLVETDTVLGVVRSPRTELADTSYDGVVDFGAVIEKEVVALELMAAEHIPVPRVLGWRRRTKPDEPSWILLSHVPHEENADIPLARLGELARQIHGIRPSAGELAPQPAWADFIWERLRQRLSAARTYLTLPDDSALQKGVTALLETREPYANRLLHMDLRSTNVCVRDGHIAALIDVANCIVGDPLMELGRIRGYGLLNDAFRAGYGLDRIGPAESTLLDVYELDTALLLTVVSVEEFDDPVLHRDQSARATRLAARIAESL